MGFMDWVFAPLFVIAALDFVAKSFRLPLRRPKGADLFPFFGILLFAGQFAGDDSRPPVVRILGGCAMALMGAGTVVLVVRWSLLRARERMLTPS